MPRTKFHLQVLLILFAAISLVACGAAENGSTTNGNIGSGGISGGGGSGGSIGYGTAYLSWLPPTQNTDGSTLSNLAGYKIYYGTSSGNYTDVITITNPGITEYVVENLQLGSRYYFVMTSFDTNGIESAKSREGNKII